MSGAGADPPAEADRDDLPGRRGLRKLPPHRVGPLQDVQDGRETGIEHAIVCQYSYLHAGNAINNVASATGTAPATALGCLYTETRRSR
ncbi:hypothetical protein Pta02_58740 [Planobispora takensis]|uniref:Uncharacterized protein n=1 Tax=Planobispora takensis TaxID=1367882 RepID=A0A8J3WVK8_9ACTN|nr:hypothetical protein Pta02_58740 [Planobispora takensis]